MNTIENGTDEAQESDERGRKEERRKLAEGVLIDGFWLVGTLLEPLPLPNPINDAAGSAATPSVAPSSSGEGYAALSALLNGVCKQHRVLATPSVAQGLLASLEPKLLASAGLLLLNSNPQGFINTDMFYRQKKVNLL